MAPLAATRRKKARLQRGGLVALIVVLGLIVAAPAGAQQADHLTIQIHDSFVDDFWTDACNTEVVVSVDGTLNVTLLYNQAGLLVKEIDPSGGVMTTYSAPSTGDSFSWPSATAIVDYGAGAEIGLTFTMRIVGLFGHVPGYIESDAGQVIFSGFVAGFDENGSPQLEFTDLLVEHGNRGSGEDITAAICSALTA